MGTGATELTGRTLTWNYDGIYRLTNETIANAPSKVNGAVSYGLDPVGNRLSTTSSITGVNSGSYSYNADDELANETYDADGNVLMSGGKTFAYDSNDRLKSMNGGAVTITYDGDGNRVAKTVNGVTTHYLIDDLNPTGYPQVVEETGSVERTYTYGLQRIDEDQVINGAWTPSFYGYDGLGSVRNLTSTSGTTTDSYEYDAWGNEITSTGTTPNVYLYRGEQYDSDLGLYYLRAMYYNPLTGRFMSRDPYDGNKILPITLHKYLYAGSNPVSHIDPTGELELFSYAIRSEAAIPEARLISIYGCVADASLAAADLILGEINPKDTTANVSTGLGVSSAVIGCVALTPELSGLAEAGNKIVKSAQFLGLAAGWGSCALDAEDFINGLNDLVAGKPAGDEISKSIEHLGGCVQDALGYLLTHPGASLQDLGLQ